MALNRVALGHSAVADLFTALSVTARLLNWADFSQRRGARAGCNKKHARPGRAEERRKPEINAWGNFPFVTAFVRLLR